MNRKYFSIDRTYHLMHGINAEPIDNPLQLGDRPYLATTVYFMCDGNIIEGGIIDGVNDAFFIVIDKDHKQEYKIDFNYVSLYDPRNPGNMIGFCKFIKSNGDVTYESLIREGESLEQRWKRICKLL